MDLPYFIGVDVGGTKCAVIAGTADMKILKKITFPTHIQKGPAYTTDHLLNAASEITCQFGANGLKTIGISCGGPLDSRKGVVQSPPNLPGWDNIPIVQMFAERFKVPAYLQNDANACALAEWKFGAGRGTDNMIFLTFGTGMGAGIIIDGRLYSGTNDLAGEVGHIRLAEDGPEAYGKKGSFEGFCSGTGIARIAQKIAGERLKAGKALSFCGSIEDIDKITTKDLAIAAGDGDQTALEIFKISGRHLGKGLSVLIDILNPQMIVIGSIYARCRKYLELPCLEVIRLEALSPAAKVCKIVPAALGEEVGDYASLSVAIVNQ